VTIGRSASFLARLTGWTVFGLGAGVLIAVVAPFAFGMRSLSVMSGSMEPAIHTGDVIADEWIPPSRARVGDVISFNDPGRGGIVLTHRVVRISRRSDRVDFVTRGDANTGVERWSAPARGRIGRVAYRIPHAGFLMVFTRTPGGRLLFLILPALGWGAWEIFRVWRPRAEEEPDGAPA
jgi:signal peptidase I